MPPDRPAARRRPESEREPCPRCRQRDYVDAASTDDDWCCVGCLKDHERREHGLPVTMPPEPA